MKELLTIQNIIFVLGGLGIALKLWLKFRPQDRDELELAAESISVVDSIVDTLLDTFEDNEALNTVDDIVDILQRQFEKAGIDVEKEQIEKKVRDKVANKDGFLLSYDVDKKKTKIEYNKEF